MPARPARDGSVRNAVLLAMLLLALGFAAAWLWFERDQRLATEVRYLSLQRVAISRDGHSMAATVALRVSGQAESWVGSNRLALQEAVKVALMAADPVRARGPDGIARLQQDIAATCNRLLNTDKVQEALVTDFLVSEGDY